MLIALPSHLVLVLRISFCPFFSGLFNDLSLSALPRLAKEKYGGFAARSLALGKLKSLLFLVWDPALSTTEVRPDAFCLRSYT